MTDPNPEAHAPLTCEGTVVGLSASPGHPFSKEPREAVRLVEGHGVDLWVDVAGYGTGRLAVVLS